MFRLITLIIFNLIVIKAYGQKEIIFKYDDVSFNYKETDLKINTDPYKDFTGRRTFLLSNSKKVLVNKKPDLFNRYLIHIGDGNINTGYLISMVVELDDNKLNILSAFGFYGYNFEKKIKQNDYKLNISELQDDGIAWTINGIKVIDRNSIPKVVLLSDENVDMDSDLIYQTADASDKINELLSLSDNFSQNYSIVPHSILGQIIKDARLWVIDSIDEIDSNKMVDAFTNRRQFFNIDNSSLGDFKDEWQMHYSKFLDCENFEFPNDCFNLNSLFDDDYISLIDDLNPLDFLSSDVKSISLPLSEVIRDSLIWGNSRKFSQVDNGFIESDRLVNIVSHYNLDTPFNNLDIFNTNKKVSFQFVINDNKQIIPNGIYRSLDLQNKYGFEGYLKDGLVNGMYHLLSNGSIKEYGTYQNGKKQGWIHSNDRRGRIIGSEYYNDGEVELDSISLAYTYYNFTPISIESPRSVVSRKYNNLSKSYDETEKFFDAVSFRASEDAKISHTFFRPSNELKFNNKGYLTTYDVELKETFGTFEPNVRDTEFIYKTRNSKKNDGTFEIECETDKSGKCKSGNAKYIKKLIQNGEDLKEEYDNGKLKTLRFNSNEELIIKASQSFENQFWNVINFVGKSISDLLGGADWSVSANSDGEFSVTVTPPGQSGSVTMNSEMLYDAFNSRPSDLPYFEHYKADVTNQAIKKSLANADILSEFQNFLIENPTLLDFNISDLDIESTDLQSIFKLDDINDLYGYFLNNSNKKSNKAKFFSPEPFIPYYWGEIGTPTITGQVRTSRSGNSQGFLAGRDNRSEPHGAIDFTSAEGETIFSPVEGKVIKIGYPSTADIGDKFVRTITIKDKNGTEVQLLYLTVDKNLKENISVVKKGEPIGVMPNMRIRFRGQENQSMRYNQDLINHIHMRIKLKDGTITDFAQIFNSVKK